MITKKENRFYNYIYMDPTKPGIYPVKGLNIILKFEPFYVGKGTGNRLNKHLCGHSGRFMKDKIMSLKEKKINPIIYKLNNNISNSEAYENEKYLVKAIGRRDLGLGTLVNLTDGGKGMYGNIPSKITRNNIKNSKLGHSVSGETRDKISKSLLGRSRSDETKEKIRSKLKLINCGSNHPQYGKKKTKESIYKTLITQRKIVLQYDLDMNFIREWESIKEASYNLKIHQSNISRACIKSKISHGFIWKFKNI